MTEIPEHRDLLGSKIAVGDSVVVPDGKRILKLGTVERLGAKMVVVCISNYCGTKKVYPADCLVVNDPRVTMYIIKHAK
jgi:hypothetical protein